jgi:stage IV sporulation protein A
MQLGEEEIREILARVLFEFPVKEIRLFMPQWVTDLKKEHWLRESVFQNIQEAAGKIERIHQVRRLAEALEASPYVESAKVTEMDLGTGGAQVEMRLKHDLFYKILGEQTGLEIDDETGLLNCMRMLNTIRKKYDRISDAMEEVTQTGYGIVMPSLEELSLEEPEIMKQGGKYGIRLRAEAPSIHMMRANITTEVSPTMGSEKQSEEMFHYLLQEFEENPAKIWDSNIFGKSLYELVNEGLHNKLYRMPEEARMRIKETLERIINEGCNGLICLIL